MDIGCSPSFDQPQPVRDCSPDLVRASEGSSGFASFNRRTGTV
jgi:hypothetical protein